MPLFHFIGLDKAGALETRLAVRPQHLDFANASGKVVLGGALLDAQGSPEGSVMIIEADHIEAAKAHLDADPYTKAGLFETSTLRPWRVAIGAIEGYAG